MDAPDVHYTIRDYEAMEGRWELIRGEFWNMAPAPTNKHQWIAQMFWHIFHETLKTCDQCKPFIAPFDWIVDESTILQPDVAIFCEPAEFFADRFRSTPLVIVEVLSPSTAIKDRNLKFRIYEQKGVQTLIFAMPEYQSGELFVLRNGRYEFVCSLFHDSRFVLELPGCAQVEIGLSEIFPETPLGVMLDFPACTL